ncbi:MAG: Gfo/Idh/MocA family oxidoreductase [Chloroflexota bacterium]
MTTRIGIIGTGNIARIHFEGWQQLPVDLVGHFDLDAAASQRASEQYGTKAYDSMDALLADVDMVDICTPSSVHKPCILAAAAAGKAIICEKPLARHIADCEEVIAACEAAGVPLYVAHVVRFFPQFAKAKEVLASGNIGNPGVIRTTRAGSFPNFGRAGFYGDLNKSGRVILDVAIHDIDYVRWCFGEVERVFARGTTFSDAPIHDHALVTLRFTNGTVGHIETSWASPPGEWRTRLEIAGDQGLIEWDAQDKDPILLALRDPDDDRGIQRSSASPLASQDNPYFAELAHFLDCYENGTEPRVTAHDALMAVKVALAAIESVRTAQPIDIATFQEPDYSNIPSGSRTGNPASLPATLPISPSPHLPVSPSSTRIAMFSYAHMHAASYTHSLQQLPGVEIVGLYDENPEHGQHIAERFGLSFFASGEALLDEGVDGVVICSENINHRPMVELAAGRVKHILCEKPISTTIEDAQAIIDVCAATDTKLQIAFPVRFSPSIQQLKTMMDSQKLGRILGVKCTNHGSMPGGWFVNSELSGGGAVIDHTVHVIDVLRWLWGSEVVEVYAEIGDSLLHPGLGIDDVGLLSFKFANGIYGTLDTSWSRPKSHPIWGDVKIELVGTDGIARVDSLHQYISVSSDVMGKHSWAGWGSNMDFGLVTDFVEMIRTGREPSITGYDGLKAMGVALAAYESAKIGKPVMIDN